MNCHSCASPISTSRIRRLQRFVSSDCQPVSAEIAIFACENCGLAQKDVSPAWKSLCDRIYAGYRIYHQAEGKEQKVRSLFDDAFRPRSEHLAAFLSMQGALPDSGRVLDIGCGNGAFLHAFKAIFPHWQPNGAEINTTFAEDIRTIAPDARFYDGDQIATLNETFGFVTLIHCLEHIPAPTSYLVGLKRLFSPQSYLLIEVPDAEKNPFDLLIADHASHFSCVSLRRVVEAAGFEVLVCGNVVLGKEITLLAKVANASTSMSAIAPPIDFLERNLEWITSLEADAHDCDAKAPIGIFGSSIAATWLGGALGDRLAFLVDEDADRIGNKHLGVSILSPAQVPRDATVLVALEPRLASRIGERLSKGGIHAITPRKNGVL